MRIRPEKTQAIVVDIQERLFPVIHENEALLENIIKLIKGLRLLNIPFIVNEQYPKGIGHTIEPIKELLSEKVHEKVTFSCCQTSETMSAIDANEKPFAILFGIETHVCVLQTAMDLLEAGYTPVLVTDCVSSRKQNDKDVTIKRMIQAGVIPTTLESLLFELCVSAKNEAFKEISKLIK